MNDDTKMGCFPGCGCGPGYDPLAEEPSEKFGVRISHWACEHGGDDVTGTKEEMEAWIVQALRDNGGGTPAGTYTVERYPVPLSQELGHRERCAYVRTAISGSCNCGYLPPSDSKKGRP